MPQQLQEWAKQQVACLYYPCLVRGREHGWKALGAPEDKSALPETWEEAGVSKNTRAGDSEYDEVPGRGSDREKKGPGELCFLGNKGCTEVSPPADSRWPLDLGSPASSFLSPAVDSCRGLEGQLVQRQQAEGKNTKALEHRSLRWLQSHPAKHC